MFGKLRRGSRALEPIASSEEVVSEGERLEEKDIVDGPVKYLTFRVFVMGIVVSFGGMIFGFDTGQISGFLEMSDFLNRFGDKQGPNGRKAFSNARSGTIVALLSIGALLGAIIAAPIADRMGRRFSIFLAAIIFCAGLIVQITTISHWYQIAIGRWVAGFGVGALSVLVPMYQSETAPKQVRGALVSCYQLFITLGILTAYCINFGTHNIENASSWRITMGIAFISPAIIAFGILFLPESPRWEVRKGNLTRARTAISKSYGVPENHRVVEEEVWEIRDKLAAETQGTKMEKLKDIVKGPRMLYRLVLGMSMQALQQLSGVNFFFYYGTSIFSSVGLTNPYATSIILGGVNFGSSFLGLYIVEHFGRRKCLIYGALWMFMCFMIFASVGHFALDMTTPSNTPGSGIAMIVFACFFIAAFAMTWGPITWAVVGELYPSRSRAICMGVATASNWTSNFLIAFFTPFVTARIDFAYGYVFAGFCAAAAVVVWCFLCESQGRSLEEIDTMYVERVVPWKSAKWQAPRPVVVRGERKAEEGGLKDGEL
ncbi:putative MFS monosaccharide transporter [Trichodelitschia bisporula]|uniref:Putative MFS monosaccharide transporter n=1 Tax=Trichodelitschia bisporula TaxID=703511 RepID=A0A6G1HK78_9PEZI|nr:putative MFS monosaccharide transporter [Trichodelitschia bisporula]